MERLRQTNIAWRTRKNIAGCEKTSKSELAQVAKNNVKITQEKIMIVIKNNEAAATCAQDVHHRDNALRDDRKSK